MIVFLDFDGVLHGVGQPPFSQLPRLEGVMRDHPWAEIVLTTSWREAYTFDKLRGLFSADIQLRVIGMTPVINDPYTTAEYRLHHRYREVLLYIDRGQLRERQWIALEDDQKNYPEDLANIVWCDPVTGLDEEAERKIRLLLGTRS